ncbi:MAG: abortive phage infection protein [Lachnospiraceae bacterium]
MTKKEQMADMAEKNNGYLFTAEVTEAGISKTYFSKYLKTNHFEKAAHGIYFSADTWMDELFVIQKSNPIVIFDRETALYLHGLTDREYSEIHVSVPKNYNTFRLKEKGMIIHSYDEELYRMGIIEIESNFGNIIKIYDKERCICDIVAHRSEVEVLTFQTAMKEYMGSPDKKLDVLLTYAEKLGLKDEIMKYVEVMI